jgi:hypothetical protein
VIDPKQFEPFEGQWLMTNPSGAVACAKVINGVLMIPYSFSEGRLTGHYYGCLIVRNTLFCRFEHFDKAFAGVLFLSIAPNETLKGGRWLNHQIPGIDKLDISGLSESMPGMKPVVWIRTRKNETPEWAEKYFKDDDWPNKYSS